MARSKPWGVAVIASAVWQTVSVQSSGWVVNFVPRLHRVAAGGRVGVWILRSP